MIKTINFSDILDLRNVAGGLKGDLPHLPILLELSICGLSRHSIASLSLDSIKGNIITWQPRRNTFISNKFSSGQLGIYEEYLEWRKTRYTKSNKLILVEKTSRVNSLNKYYMPVKPERVRSDIRALGNSLELPFNLEISYIHKAVADYLILNGADKKIISKIYKI